MRRDQGPVRRLATAALAFGIVVGACAGSTPPSPASPSVGPAQRASDVQGAFQLTFELPRTTYRAGEAIEGRATLGVIGGAAVAFGSSGGGPFVFDFAEIGGRRRVGGAMTADCAPYRLEPGRPMASAITKSGGYSADDPEARSHRRSSTGTRSSACRPATGGSRRVPHWSRARAAAGPAARSRRRSWSTSCPEPGPGPGRPHVRRVSQSGKSATNLRMTRARRGPATAPAARTSSWVSGSPE